MLIVATYFFLFLRSCFLHLLTNYFKIQYYEECFLFLFVLLGFVACEKENVNYQETNNNSTILLQSNPTAQMISDFNDFNEVFFKVFDAAVNLDSSELATLRNLDETNYNQLYSITGVTQSEFLQYFTSYDALQNYDLTNEDFSAYLYNTALNLNSINAINMSTFYHTFTDFNPTGALPCWAYALTQVAIVAGSLAGGAIAGPIGLAAGGTVAVGVIVQTVDTLLEHGPSGKC